MPNRWKNLNISKFYGLDKKTNPLYVKDGFSLDNQNVFQDTQGVVSKRRGGQVMFSTDLTSTIHIDEIGSAYLSGLKYFFQFANGNFEYSLTINGAKTTIASAYTAGNTVWWAVLDDKIWFVDGSIALKFFDPNVGGGTINESLVYERSATAPTSSGGAGFDYVFTVEHGYSATITSAESPASNTVAGGSAATITVPDPYVKVTGGNQDLVVGDRIRIYSRVNTTITSFKNVTPTAGAHANGVYEIDPEDGGGYLRLTSLAASYAIVSVAITDDQANLYTNLGLAVNKTAVTNLTGLTSHYGRLVAWKTDTVYNSKSSNPHSWPDDSANNQAFQYTVGLGDEFDLTRCLSFQESLYVFKENQIFVFGGIGPDDTGGNAYSFRRLETNGIGALAPKSVAVVGERAENMIVFLSNQGFYASNGSTPERIGSKIENDVYTLGKANKQSACAFYHKRDGAYICFLGNSTSRIGYYLDVTKDDNDLVGWFKWAGLNIKSIFWDEDHYLAGTYSGYSFSERNAYLDTDFSDISVEYVLAAAITTATDQIAVTGVYATGDQITFRTSGTIPAGLVNNTSYFVILVSATVIKLAATLADAQANIPIDITTQGVGTHSIIKKAAIDAYYVTNWINFGSTSIVKKLGKPSIAFDTTATTINLDIDLFYDWVENAFDTINITIANMTLWGAGTWGSFVWGGTLISAPRSLAIPRRKVRSIRFKFSNDVIDQDFNLQSIEIPFDAIRNRGNFS